LATAARAGAGRGGAPVSVAPELAALKTGRFLRRLPGRDHLV
jgi:hypothetical protein